MQHRGWFVSIFFLFLIIHQYYFEHSYLCIITVTWNTCMKQLVVKIRKALGDLSVILVFGIVKVYLCMEHQWLP